MKKKVFKWRQGARIGIDAEVAAAALHRLEEENDGLKPLQVVDAARKKRHPLHRFFEWDDGKAAESYRVEQAKYLIRSLEITVVNSSKKGGTVLANVTSRGFISLGKGLEDGPDSRFLNSRRVVSDADLRRQVLGKVWNQLRNLRRQYDNIQELAELWELIDGTEKKLQKAM